MVVLSWIANCIWAVGQEGGPALRFGRVRLDKLLCNLVVRDCDVYRLKRHHYLTLATATLVHRAARRASACARAAAPPRHQGTMAARRRGHRE